MQTRAWTLMEKWVSEMHVYLFCAYVFNLVRQVWELTLASFTFDLLHRARLPTGGERERGLIYYIFLWVARAPLHLFSRLARRIRPPMCVNNFSIFKLKEVTRYEMDFLIWSKHSSVLNLLVGVWSFDSNSNRGCVYMNCHFLLKRVWKNSMITNIINLHYI